MKIVLRALAAAAAVAVLAPAADAHEIGKTQVSAVLRQDHT